LPIFTAVFAFATLLGIGAIFVISLKKRGLKLAMLYSAVALISFVAIFIVFLILPLNIM
jgi:hypothetical protein